MKITEHCTGCGACAPVCPRQAISFHDDDKGFLSAVIDNGKCISCGLCLKTCPQNAKPIRFESKPLVLTFRLPLDSDRMRSQSGGAFYEIASRFIDQGGIVYGVAMVDPYHAETIRVDDLVGLERLRKSKYVQADPTESLISAKEDLSNGRSVLFSGTACQIAGLTSYLSFYKTPMGKLVTLDIICHGVPSPGVYRRWMSYLEKKEKSKLNSVVFRDKTFGWGAGVPTYDFENGQTSHNRSYYVLFVENLILNECCYECSYADKQRKSDITIGDFWGIEKTEFAGQNDNKGFSIVFLRDQRLLPLLGGSFIPLQDQRYTQANMENPSGRNSKSSSFWWLYHRHPVFAIKWFGGYYRRKLKKLLHKK